MFAHGSFSSASCISCGAPKDLSELKTDLLGDSDPRCLKCGGLAKPDLVFFGEQLPDRFQMFHEDCLFCDYLVCVGTSLEVYPFAGIADHVPHSVPRLLLNRCLVGSFGSRQADSVLSGDLVDSVVDLAKAMGLADRLDQMCQEYKEGIK